MPRRPPLADRVEDYANMWISNPAARLEFVYLIRAVRIATSAARVSELLEWTVEEIDKARRIGITRRDL